MKEMPLAMNVYRAMDFVSDQMYNGKRFRALTVLDLFITVPNRTLGDLITKRYTN